MSDHAGQDNGTLRVTIREAASRLGVTEAAVRKRIQRGSLGKELGQDGRVYVYLDLSQDTSHPESQVHRDPIVEELVEELRDRVAFLERSLERRSVEAERYQQIVAGLSQTNAQLSARVLELEPPATTPGSSQPGEAGAEAATNGPPGPAPPADVAEAQNGAHRPWWRRVFGG
jgi:hypothetical protein